MAQDPDLIESSPSHPSSVPNLTDTWQPSWSPNSPQTYPPTQATNPPDQPDQTPRPVHFIDDIPAPDPSIPHIDIAGPVWDDATGATGYGAKLVSEWVKRQGEASEESD